MKIVWAVDSGGKICGPGEFIETHEEYGGIRLIKVKFTQINECTFREECVFASKQEAEQCQKEHNEDIKRQMAIPYKDKK